MPQFELQIEDQEHAFRGIVRALDAPDALRRALDLGAGVDLVVGSEEDLHAWRPVRIAGRPAGRIRSHHRMRFRRD